MIQKLFKYIEAKPKLSHRLTRCFGFLDFLPCRIPGCHLAFNWWYCSTAIEEERRGRGARGRDREAEGEGSGGGGPPVPGSPVCMQEDTVKWL